MTANENAEVRVSKPLAGQPPKPKPKPQPRQEAAKKRVGPTPVAVIGPVWTRRESAGELMRRGVWMTIGALLTLFAINVACWGIFLVGMLVLGIIGASL